MAEKSSVKLWEDELEIPTYGVGAPDKNPMFFEKRVYQGSSGRVYPFPVIDRIGDEKKPKKWRVVFLENEYLRLWVMPELGGRIQRALDKTNGYDFVYYNHVVKPALVGLAGPWISGGIEFNWPQHHRPSTFLPVEHTTTENADGSKTVWLGEIDRMYGTRCTTGITLHPGKAYVEITGSLYNPTPQPQTFLWWANPAYAVNDHTRSVFPPDVHAVFDHGKRAVSKFPIATGTYYKVDYSAGVDISRYKNLPVPTSYMAYHSDYDFVGGYDEQKRAGLLHVADHHISPGKKQWTWGSGDFGKAWDRNLTDADGPYIELMTGVFTDNQPDFSWMKPYEHKHFTQYFLPYKDLGAVKNATKDLALALSCENGQITAAVYATSAVKNLTVSLQSGRRTYFSQTADLSPEKTFSKVCALADGDDGAALELRVSDEAGRELLSYAPGKDAAEPVPDAAKPIPAPADIRTNEELLLAGMHIEQYRHATREPQDYYLEGLKRDPHDARINNAYGALLLRRGRFAESERYFASAVQSAAAHNANLYDSEPYYNLGLALLFQHRYDAAYDRFYQSVWSEAARSAGYFSLAVIDTYRRDDPSALAHLDDALESNGRHFRALDLKTAVLRRMGRLDEAEQNARATLAADVLDFGARNELALLARARGDAQAERQYLAQLAELLRASLKNHLVLAVDYLWAGFYGEAAEVLLRYVSKAGETASPMAWYYLGFIKAKEGDAAAAAEFCARGRAASPDYCFPNRLEDILVLEAAQAADPADARAPYYLGCLWYDRRQYDAAVACFERSRALDAGYPTVHRNLAIAYFNKQNDAQKALDSLEKAYRLDPTDARVLLELDQLRKKRNMPPKERLERLERRMEQVEARDDLYTEYITLLNTDGQCARALKLMAARKFHPWEGGEGKITKQYVYALVETAKACIRAGRFEEAAEKLRQAKRFPHNLGEGKLFGAQENDVNYYLGAALEGLGDAEGAKAGFEAASVGLSEPASAMFYNDQPPEMIFYQGLARARLGRADKARGVFNRLIDYGEKHLGDHVAVDYFAVSLPDLSVFDDDLDRRNRAHCHYLIGLGRLGFGRTKEAAEEFQKTLVCDAGHQGALTELRACGN